MEGGRSCVNNYLAFPQPERDVSVVDLSGWGKLRVGEWHSQ